MCNNFPSCFSFQQETCSGSGKWAPRWILPALITTLNTKGFYHPDTVDFNFPETSHWSLKSDRFLDTHSLHLLWPQQPQPLHGCHGARCWSWRSSCEWIGSPANGWNSFQHRFPCSQHDMGIVICRQHNWVNFWWRVSFHGSVGKSLALERCTVTVCLRTCQTSAWHCGPRASACQFFAHRLHCWSASSCGLDQRIIPLSIPLYILLIHHILKFSHRYTNMLAWPC